MDEARKEERRRAALAVKLWVVVTLSLISILGILTIWHLVRRGRMIRDQLGPAKDVRLPEFPLAEEPPP